jgi:hypothetical protein
MTVYSIFIYVGIAAALLTALRYFIARPQNWVVCYLQNFVGSLFIFSGFVKAVDPLGTGYKMHEYFEAFAGEGLRPFWEWIANYSTYMSIIMIAAELFFGFALIIGWQRRFTITIIWWLTLFFTLLTGYTYLSGYVITHAFILLAIVLTVLFAIVSLPTDTRRRNRLLIVAFILLLINAALGKFTSMYFTKTFEEAGMKVTDCGCFGDFIKLKPWETFYKDVFLDVLILILVLGVREIKPVFGNKVNGALAGVAAFAASFLCIYTTYLNEPIIDFRPYAIGNNIEELRHEKVPAKIDMLFTYKNKKTGEEKNYKMDELNKVNNDEEVFVKRKDVVLDPGIPAKVLGLNIMDEDGNEVTDDLLTDPNYTLIVVTWNFKETHEDAFKNLNGLADAAKKSGVKMYGIVVNDGHSEEFKQRNGIAYPFYYCDETPIKTMMRSNPGLVLMKNGVIVNKWHYRHFPTFEELNKEYFKK